MLVHREHLLGLLVWLLTFYRKGALCFYDFYGYYWLINTRAFFYDVYRYYWLINTSAFAIPNMSWLRVRGGMKYAFMCKL